MRTSELNEWLQIVASVGVIVGLLFVAYEVRQSNMYAAAEAHRSNFSGWEDISVSEYETDIADLYVRSFEDPTSLSTAEMFKLSAYLTAVMNQYERALKMSDLGLSNHHASDLTRWSQDWFGSPFGRAWLQENKSWIDPRHIAAIERGLQSASERSSPGYYERIESAITDRTQ